MARRTADTELSYCCASDGLHEDFADLENQRPAVYDRTAHEARRDNTILNVNVGDYTVAQVEAWACSNARHALQGHLRGLDLAPKAGRVAG